MKALFIGLRGVILESERPCFKLHQVLGWALGPKFDARFPVTFGSNGAY